MKPDLSNRKSRLIQSGIGAIMVLFGPLAEAAYADEGGISFWLPGHFSSLAATPQVPGWSWAEVSHDGISVGRRCCGKRDSDRQVLADS